jgi:hypothetical protein
MRQWRLRPLPLTQATDCRAGGAVLSEFVLRLLTQRLPGTGTRTLSQRAARNSLNFLVLLERAKGFEPSTPTLARLCSTPELHPHP